VPLPREILNFGFSQGRFPVSRLLLISVSIHVSKNGSRFPVSPRRNHGNGFWETPCRFPIVIRRFPQKVYYRRKPRRFSLLRKAFKGIQSHATTFRFFQHLSVAPARMPGAATTFSMRRQVSTTLWPRKYFSCLKSSRTTDSTVCRRLRYPARRE
jgi:hypothetical protein